MNAKRFRLVFNRIRGMLVAVDEHASGGGGGQSASISTFAHASSLPPRAHYSRLVRRVASAGVFAAVCMLGGRVPAAWAQATLPVTPDRSVAGTHPVIGVAGNGVPVVNIVKPNGTGMSHNHFGEYNVGTAGMVLNNASANAPTQVAGWVQPNPFIGAHPARTILNEVHAGNPSQLLGMTEVAGQRARVVVANPAGIYCNGCGFINAPRVTLSTGAPRIEGGALAGYDVAGGALSVGGQGLDARGSSRIDLIARAMRINGQIWAQRLDAVAGVNRVSLSDPDANAESDLRVEPRAAERGPAVAPPEVAIDVAALGGMYANAVRLVSTEHGVGVNLGGAVNSLTGDVRVTSDGALTIAPAGAVLAAHDAVLDAASIRNAGTIAAQGGATLLAAASFVNQGDITARRDVSASARDIDNAGAVAAGVDAQGSASGPGRVSLAATNLLTNAGSVQAGGAVALGAVQADLSGGSVRGGESVSVAVTGDLGHRRASMSGAALDVRAGGTLDNADGMMIGAQAVALVAGTLDNRGGAITSQGELELTTQTLENAGGQLAAQRDLDVAAVQIHNQGGTVGSVAGNTTLRAQAVDNALGVISGAGDLKLDARALSNVAGRISGGAIAIGLVPDAGGPLEPLGPFEGLDGLDNTRGEIVSNSDTAINATALGNGSGTIAGRSVRLEVTGALDNESGKIVADHALDVAAGTLANRAGSVTSTGSANLTANNELDNSSGTIAASGDVQVAARDLRNDGGTLGSAEGALNVVVGDAMSNDGGSVAAARHLTLTTGSLSNRGGRIGGQDVAFLTGAADNTGGAIVAQQGNLAVDAHAFINAGGVLQAAGAVGLDAHGHDIDNQGGLIIGETGVSLHVGALDNSAQGVISSAGTIELDSERLDNDAGSVTAQGDLAIKVTDTLANRRGTLGANGNVTLHAELVDNDRGLVHAGADLALDAGTVSNTNTREPDVPEASDTSSILAAWATSATSAEDTEASRQPGTGLEGHRVSIVAGDFDNTSGALRSDASTRLISGTVDNTGGTIESAGEIDAAVHGWFSNAAGNLNGGTAVNLAAGALTGGGTIQTRGDLDLAVRGDFINTGTVRADHDVNLTATGRLTNSASITAGAALAVDAHDVINTASGVLAGQGSTRITAVNVVVNDGLINGGDTRIDAHDIHNTGRIYGDTIAIGADRLINDTNALGIAGVIASRGDLDLGVASLESRDGAYLLAERDLRIGARLDDTGRASGSAAQVLNDGATIEAGRDLSIAATQIDNLNSRFATGTVTSTDDTPRYFYTQRGSDVMMPGESTRFYHANGKPYELRPGNQDPQASLQGDYSWYLILPSDKYPQERFGPPFDYNGTTGNPLGGGLHPSSGAGELALLVANCWPVGVAYTPVRKNDDGSGLTAPEAFGYAPDDKIWAVYGVEPPAAALASEPVNTCVSGDRACAADFEARRQAWDAAHTAYVARYSALNDAIIAFNRDFKSRQLQDFDVYSFERTTTTTDTVTDSAPGQILAGRNLVSNGTLNNDKGRLVAGADFNGSGAATINADALGERTSIAYGTLQYTYKGGDREWQMLNANLERPLAHEQIHLPILPTSEPGRPETIQTVAAVSGAAQGAGADLHIAQHEAQGGTVGAVGSAAPAANLGADVIRTMTPPLRLPNNALYRTLTDPGSRYLVETDPAYANYRTWISSDTMLRAVRQNPDTVLKRIGDGFYEQQLVAQQVLALTGQRFTGDYTNTQDEYAALLSGGAAAARDFDLAIGTALTEAQVAALASDIVWLVKQSVTLADGSTQEVLAPQVYLRARDAQVTGTGALIAGHNVSLVNRGDVYNSGTIAARDIAVVKADTVRNVNGTLAGSDLVAHANTDLSNLGGLIAADQVRLTAGRDIELGSQAWTMETASNSSAGIGALGAIAARNLVVGAGRDLQISAAGLEATGDMALSAGRDIALDTLRVSDTQRGVFDDANQRTTALSADLGSALSAGGNLALVAGRDLGAAAAYASAGDNLTLAAGHDVNLTAGSASRSVAEQHHYEAHEFLSTEETTTRDNTSATRVLGTTLSGGAVTVSAGHDLTTAAATIASTGDVNLAAGHDLDVGTASGASAEHHFIDVKRTGLGASGADISWGSNQTTDTVNDRTATAQGSLIGSTGGSVHLAAGNTLHIGGSDIIAAGDVTGVGANVVIDAARNDRHHDETHEAKSSGFSLGVKAPLLDALQNVQEQVDATGDSQDSRTAALHAMAAAGGLLNAADAAQGLAQSAQTGQPDIKVELSWGSSSSKSTLSEDSVEHNGSVIQAGGTAAFVATGNGTPGSGDLTIAGSDVLATNVVLQAARDVNLIASTDTDATRSTNESKSTSIGVSYGAASGWGVSASMAKSNGSSASDAQWQNNTHIHAADTATIISGNDTSLIGATLDGNRIQAAIGGNLNIASVHDSVDSTAHQQSTGGGFSISQGGGSASFSHSEGSASSHYAGVNEQSGITSGAGGYDIRVTGNTDLDGAYIVGSTDPGNNSLTTGSLTWRDQHNESSYDAKSGGFSAGGGYGKTDTTHGPASGQNVGGIGPSLGQHDHGHDSALTVSAIGAGDIKLTNPDGQTQDLAGLNRDTTHLNGTVDRTPDLNDLLANQADSMAAAAAAGEAVAKGIGKFADRKRQEALAAGNRDEAAKWGEGGENRTAMHAAGGALVAGLGGGNALGGAAGAGISSELAGIIGKVSDTVAGASPTGNPELDAALGNIVGNALAGGAGFAVGGSSGAFAGANSDRFNRQLHPQEREWINERELEYAKQYGLAPEEAHNELMMQANLQVQNGSEGTWNQRASAFLSQAHGILPADGESGPGYMFYATPEQKANSDMYAGHYGNGVGMNVPGAQDIANSVNRERVLQDINTKLTWGAIAGAAGITALGPAAMIPGAPLLGTEGALGSGTWASPLGTGAISAGISAGAQYFQDGKINPSDAAGSFATGYAGTYGGLLWNIGVNAVGGATTAALNNFLQGKSDNVADAGITSGLFSTIGYGIGRISGNSINSSIRPTINNSTNWVGSGVWSRSGYSIFSPNNAAAIGATSSGGVAREGAQSLFNHVPNKGSN